MSSFKIIVPVYLGGEVIDNLIRSIDVDWSHLIIVDNTPDSYCKKYGDDLVKKGALVFYYPENIGVARAWNIGLKADCDWTFLLSQAAVFPNGFSSFLLDIDPLADFYISTEGYHCFGISQNAVRKVGYFDTNFYPAYFEDADYGWRMIQAGLRGDYSKAEVAITSVGSSSGLGAKINFQALTDYFIEKWGAGPNDEPDKLSKLPFGDKPLTYFPERSVKELKNKYGV